MAKGTNIVVDYQGQRYKAYINLMYIDEDIYSCRIENADNKGEVKEVGTFYFDSSGGTEYTSEIANVVLDILFDNNSMIREFSNIWASSWQDYSFINIIKSSSSLSSMS